MPHYAKPLLITICYEARKRRRKDNNKKRNNKLIIRLVSSFGMQTGLLL